MAITIRCVLIALVILLLALASCQTGLAAPVSEVESPVVAAAMKLVAFGKDKNAKLDAEALATLVHYVVTTKPDRQAALPSHLQATGAYHEFDTNVRFTNFLAYAYSSRIPSVLTNPSSIRYALWSDLAGGGPKLPANWKPTLPGGEVQVIRGLERVGITPDLTTGVYYEYDLNKTLIHFNYKGQQTIVSVSNLISRSDVGKKGVILGNDNDWSYYYSGEPGSTKTGLGWIKSYIYDYFSVGVHIESGARKDAVRSGVFQWIRAGWSGINFVEPHHVIMGMKRNASTFTAILESPRLPSPDQLVTTYQYFAALSRHDLLQQYVALEQGRASQAVLNGQFRARKTKTADAYEDTTKEQIIEELMLERLRATFGKPALPAK